MFLGTTREGVQGTTDPLAVVLLAPVYLIYYFR